MGGYSVVFGEEKEEVNKVWQSWLLFAYEQSYCTCRIHSDMETLAGVHM